MSDEKEAAARRPYYDRAASALDPFTANAYGMAWRALDASGVWERIEELERERADLMKAAKLRAKAIRDLSADNTRLRAELQRRDAEWGELAAEKDHWQRRYLEAERHRTELLILIGLMRDEKARLREALARILDEAGVLKLGGVRRVARAALAETQETT